MSDPAIPFSAVLVEEFKSLTGMALKSNEAQPGGADYDLEERTKHWRDHWRKLEAPGNEQPVPGNHSDWVERQAEASLVAEIFRLLHTNPPRAALCLSGGGIRSATFALGVIQGLAKKRLLTKFDYLSTVSGGGYAGSWLSAWLYRARDPNTTDARQAALNAVGTVEGELGSPPASPLSPEPEPLRHLRSHSRYMSPKMGVLSVDTWTLAATYFRNLLLNWLIFVPLLAALLMLPRLSIMLIRIAESFNLEGSHNYLPALLYWLAIFFGAIGIGYVAPARPSKKEVSTLPPKYQTQLWYLALCQLPLMLMAVCITTNWAWLQLSGLKIGTLPFFPNIQNPWTAFFVFGALIQLGGWAFSRIWVRQLDLVELLAAPISGGIGGLALWWCALHVFPPLGPKSPNAAVQIALYVTFSTPIVLMLYMLASILFVALVRRITTDTDREWMARSSGWMLITIAFRCFFALLVFFGPVLLVTALNGNLVETLLTSVVGGISGILTLLIGVSSKTGLVTMENGSKKNDGKGVYDLILAVAAPIFIVFLLMTLALASTLYIHWLSSCKILARFFGYDVPKSETWLDNPGYLIDMVVFAPWWAVLIGLGSVLLVCGMASFMIDINRFSMHATYRDRLIRAYVGASRGQKRQAHPFVGFDEQDNLRIHTLADNRPMPVINIALNLVGGPVENQDRKASSFTVTPLHSGSYKLAYRSSKEYALAATKNRRKSGISLGTAMTISGAAASPNMGYHSSPVITFLMAAFNVRLGWWLGNPGSAGDSTYQDSSPKWAAWLLLREAFGLTTDRASYVYLSDGGHFENLGLYEMVLRRCRFIVVSDASHDPKFDFEDLGNAITKIRIDLGIPIVFESIDLRPREEPGKRFTSRGTDKNPAPYVALGRILYSKVDGKAKAPKGDGGQDAYDPNDGYLLYIKPTLNGSEPINVYQYAQENPAFPHEPTSDQFYSETQFESYRSLGEHILDTTLKGFDGDLEKLFTQLESRFKMKGGQPEEAAKTREKSLPTDESADPPG